MLLLLGLAEEEPAGMQVTLHVTEPISSIDLKLW